MNCQNEASRIQPPAPKSETYLYRPVPDADLEEEPIPIAAEPANATRPKRKPAPRVRVASDGDARPVIRTEVSDLHVAIDRAIGVLASDDDLYQRDGHLVHVVRTTAEEADYDPSLVVDTPQIRHMATATLRERLTRAARWERRRRGEWVTVLPSDHIVNGVLCRGMWSGIRPMIGVIEAPALRPDGSVIVDPGYDRATGFQYMPSVRFPALIDEPTEQDAREALADLADVFRDFPYEGEAHRYVPISALLTLVARPAIRGAVPGFLFDATTRGSGKSLQSDVVSLIATGRPTAKMSYPVDDVELEKVLGSYAIRAPALINFDNITRPFGGGPLDRVLTAEDTVELRVLGRSEIPTLRWRSVIVGTGNNISLTGDTSRRVLVSRLESPLENPEDRDDFAHPDLLGWVREERPRLVCAALTVLRGFISAGRPVGPCKTWGSFGPWSALIPPAIVYAGGTDPMLTRPTVTGAEEPEKAALAIILRDWPRLDASCQGLTVKSAIEALYSADRLRGREVSPDGFDDLREAIEALVPAKPGQAPDAHRLGNKLRGFKGRVVGGRKLDAINGHRGVLRWRVI